MAKVIKFDTSVLTVSELLERSCDLKGLLILGINPDDTQFFGVAELTTKEVIYMIELCKHFILTMEN